jgi:hypothetical protein
MQGKFILEKLFINGIIGLTVLDGEVAVPCNSQSARARFNSFVRAGQSEQSEVWCDEFLVLRNETL